MSQPRWKDGSRGMLTVCGLFAGFTGVVLVNLIIHIVGDSKVPQEVSFFSASIFLAGIALWLFAFAAERITDALDEDNVRIYFWSMFYFNVGVIFLFASIACLLFNYSWNILAIFSLIATIKPWGIDVCWFLFSGKESRAKYVAGLQSAGS
jgi:hypothetical protein